MKISKAYRKRVKAAFGEIGTISLLVKKMRIHEEVARKIVTGNCIVSPRRAIIIESITGVSRKVLRPDIFG